MNIPGMQLGSYRLRSISQEFERKETWFLLTAVDRKQKILYITTTSGKRITLAFDTWSELTRLGMIVCLNGPL